MEIISDKDLYQAAMVLGKHLDFSSFLNESRLLIQQYTPLEKVILAGFSPGSSLMTIISVADQEGIKDIGGKLSVPAEAAKGLSGMGAPVSMFKRASASVPARLLIEKKFLAGDASLIVMRMILGKSTIGLLFCSAAPGKEFGREHGALFAELRPVLSLGIGNCLQYRTVLSRQQRLKEDVDYLAGQQSDQGSSEVVGAGMGLNGVMQEVRRLVATDLHIGISGEQGSGRTFIARKIHGLSKRQDKPFVEINCSLIPEKQLEEHLFGDGRSTDVPAGPKKGLLLRAAGGTVYLKGVGRLPNEVQSVLAKVATSGEIIRKAKKERIKCDVRFITLIDSEQDKQSPLFDILGSTGITIPPLRDRREDIPRLADYFTEQSCRKMNRFPLLKIDEVSLERCLKYDWPGNVRELENIIERGVLLSGGEGIDLIGLLPSTVALIDHETAGDEDLNLDKMITQHIVRCLKQSGGKVGGADGAAALMGINPSTLRKRMRKLNIPFGRKTNYNS